MKIPNKITAVDLHACGEPGRVIVLGDQNIPGKTIFAKKTYLETKADGLRKLMLREPRGYPAANCNIILPPTHPDADVGMIIMEQVEYPAMSGTNTMCVVTALLETGILPAHVPITKLVLDTPAGLVHVEAEVRKSARTNSRNSKESNFQVVRVTFENVPAFAVHLDKNIEVPHLGPVKVDVAYGGMWYVIADAEALGLQLTPDRGRDIVRVGEMVKAAAREQLPVAHPENPGIAGVTIAVLSGPPTKRGAHAKNAVVVSTGQLDWKRPATWTGAIDRSPCGTGTCAKMAVLHAKGQLALNKDFVHEGILGTTFTGRLIRETKVGPYRAVVPTISGRAWITGYAQYVLDPSDPFPEGFTLGDIWGSG
jgi:proline racemase